MARRTIRGWTGGLWLCAIGVAFAACGQPARSDETITIQQQAGSTGALPGSLGKQLDILSGLPIALTLTRGIPVTLDLSQWSFTDVIDSNPNFGVPPVSITDPFTIDGTPYSVQHSLDYQWSSIPTGGNTFENFGNTCPQDADTLFVNLPDGATLDVTMTGDCFFYDDQGAAGSTAPAVTDTKQVDLLLERTQAVPEGSSLALLCGGLAPLAVVGLVRHRRQQ